MKIIFRVLLFSIILYSPKVHAQIFDVDTLQYQGTTRNMINLVILSDGYTQDQLEKFARDAAKFKEFFFSESPYSQYRRYFNVFIIRVPSLESGVKHAHNAEDCPKAVGADTGLVTNNQVPYKRYVPTSNPNNYFGSSFDNFGIHRLVVAHNQQAIKSVLKANFPEYTQTIILANTPYYGGSGGLFPTATVNMASNGIAIHELAHSFGGLTDEYWAGLQYLGENVNQSQYTSPELVPWKAWLGTPGIGIYTYGGKAPNSVWYRPSEYCKMQFLIAPFCSVCTEAIIEKIHSKTSPIISILPKNQSPISVDSLKVFRVNLAKPDPNSLKVGWYLNGEFLTSNVDSVRINIGVLKKGENILRVSVSDTTAMVRTASHDVHRYESQWIIQNSAMKTLKPPVLKWDSLQTTRGTEAVLTIKNPEAGISYYWYAREKSKREIFKGTNFVTPKITEPTTFYVAAKWKTSYSTRTPATVLPQASVLPPAEILATLTAGDTIKISIINPSADLHYRWFTSLTDVKPLTFYADNSSFLGINRTGTELKISKASAAKIYYVQSVSIKSTTFSERKRVDLTTLVPALNFGKER